MYITKDSFIVLQMIKATYLLKKRLRFKGVHVALTGRLLYSRMLINVHGFSGVTKLHQTQVNFSFRLGNSTKTIT